MASATCCGALGARVARRAAPAARAAARAPAAGAGAAPAAALAERARRGAAALAAAAALAGAAAGPAAAIKLADAGTHKILCDSACEESIAEVQPVTTPSGLKYIDIIEGSGDGPVPGDQVSIDTVGSIDKGMGAQIFEDSLDRGSPIDIRVGTEEPLLILGLDEGVMGMKMGGVRRMFIEGELSYGKSLPAAPGRPAIPEGAPVVFDVRLNYIPGALDGPLGEDDADADLADLEAEFGL